MPPLKIVVVEDHDALRIVTVDMLQQNDYEAVGISCAEDLDEMCSELADIFIIDLNLPDEDGISLTKRIKKVSPHVGIIMATARDKLEDKILGYQSGADIYLPKPIYPAELLAAISALSRRIELEKIKHSLVLEHASLLLKSREGNTIRLNNTEATILLALARAKQQQLEYWQLIDVLNCVEPISKSNLEVKIYRLRQKLIEIGEDKNAIRSIRKQGYQLCIPLISN